MNRPNFQGTEIDMAITTDHFVGADVGIGVAAAGFYLCQKNRDKVDQFLRSHGMNIPVREDKPLASMSIAELATEANSAEVAGIRARLAPLLGREREGLT